MSSSAMSDGSDAKQLRAPGEQDVDQEGPGCLPAFLAFGAIILIILFISCGVSSWWLWQQRTEIAIKTLQGTVIPELEQSALEPAEKQAVIELIQGVVRDGEAGKLEDWQAAGIMERLSRSPLLQWGDLVGFESLILASDGFSVEEKQQASMHLSRLKRASELGTADSEDLYDCLSPVLIENQSQPIARLDRQATVEQMRDVVLRCKIVAERESIPEQTFEVNLADIIRRQIEAGRSQGGS